MHPRFVLIVVALIFILLGLNTAHATNKPETPANSPTTASSASHSDAAALAASAASSKSESAAIGIGGASNSTSISKGGAGGDAAAVAVGGASNANANGGDAKAEGGSSSSNNSMVYNEARNKTVASTPAAVVGNTTAQCRSFIGLSGMGRDGGGGLGFPITDADCKFGILAEAAFNRGNRALGAQLYCKAPTVVKAIGYDACVESFGETAPSSTAVVVPVPSTAGLVTREELNEKLNRVAKDAVSK